MAKATTVNHVAVPAPVVIQVIAALLSRVAAVHVNCVLRPEPPDAPCRERLSSEVTQKLITWFVRRADALQQAGSHGIQE